MELSGFERVEVDVPDTIVDFFQAYVLPGADSRDIDPVRVPVDVADGHPGEPACLSARG